MNTIGNAELLKSHKVAFFCSRKFPAEAALKSYRWADEQREAGSCVISGYHSPIEKDVLCRLLKGTQPVIIAMAMGLKRLPSEWDGPLAANRLLIVSRYADSVSHPCESKCYQRNRMMMEIADRIVIAYASAGGNLERLCKEYPQKILWL